MQVLVIKISINILYLFLWTHILAGKCKWPLVQSHSDSGALSGSLRRRWGIWTRKLLQTSSIFYKFVHTYFTGACWRRLVSQNPNIFCVKFNYALPLHIIIMRIFLLFILTYTVWQRIGVIESPIWKCAGGGLIGAIS